ncbi:MAG: hypothetical protein SNJ64_03415, partial [Endomicrobiia bacterium]
KPALLYQGINIYFMTISVGNMVLSIYRLKPTHTTGTNKYILENIIPSKYRNDALHIAIAVVNDSDVVVSWNLEHIVKLKTKSRQKALIDC